MSDDKREGKRTPMRCRIRIWHESFGEIYVFTRDVSNTGVFILAQDEEQLRLGEIVKGQIQGMPMEAPILNMEVMRLASEGMGLRFCGEN